MPSRSRGPRLARRRGSASPDRNRVAAVQAGKAGKKADWDEFKRWLELFIDTCGKLADFQSPRFRAIAVVAQPPAPSYKDKSAEVVRPVDPVEAVQVYQRLITRVRG